MRLSAPHAIKDTANQWHIAAGELQQALFSSVTTWTLHSWNSGFAPRKAETPVLLSRSGALPSFQHCPMNHLRWWKPDLLRSRIQTATQRETASVLRLSRDVSSINSDCW